MNDTYPKYLKRKLKVLSHKFMKGVRWLLTGRRKFAVIGLSLIFVVGSLAAVFFWDSGEQPVRAAVDQVAEVVNLTSPNDNTAQKGQKLRWQKQLKLTPADAQASSVSIEKIPNDQVYQSGSVQLPPGWNIQYSTTTVANPTTDQDYSWQDAEPVPADTVTYLRFYTDTVTTTKPAVQNALTKPLDREDVVTSLTGATTLAAKEYQNKVFTIFRAVDVENGVKDNGSGTNDSSDVTIACLDLETYKSCTDFGVSFPTYMSSAAGTKLGEIGSPKDISTPVAMKYGFDSGNGHLYIPAQKGNTYGVNCIDLAKFENCGYTSMGTSPAPAQAVGQNPVLIQGFAEKDGKLYGHANNYSADSNIRNDFLQMICFDMATQAKCSNYSSDVISNIPSMYITEHGNKFDTPGQNVILGDRYYFLMNYDYGSTNINTTVKTQSFFGNRLVCYDVVQKSNCTSWPFTNNVSTYFYYTGFFVPNYDYQNVQGRSLGEDIYQIKRPTQLFFWKGVDGSVKAICITSTKQLPTEVDPSAECFKTTDGSNYSETVSWSLNCNGSIIKDANGNPTTRQETSNSPRCLIPLQWLNVPWEPASAVVNVTNDTQDRMFLSWHIAAQTVFGGKDKAAVICYDWKIQRSCEKFRSPHYWYEINEADTKDSDYVADGKCIIGVSAYNFLWSFDSETGETPCRKNFNRVTVKPASDLGKAFCDGKTRTPQWGYLRLNRADLHNFRNVTITIKDSSGNVVNGLQNIELKDQPSEQIDLSSIVYGTGSGQYSELQVEIDSESWNTSSWPLDKNTLQVKTFPLATVVMPTGAGANADTAQYCYQTVIKPNRCDIDKVLTTSDVKSQTSDDVLVKTKNTQMTVVQPSNVQCFRDLKVGVKSDKTTVGLNENLSYTIEVDNQANQNDDNIGSVTGATLEATLPSGVSVVDSDGATVVGSKLRWTNLNLAPQDKVTKTIQIKAPSSVSSAPPQKGRVYAAIVQKPLVVQAQVIYAEDYNSVDNSVSDNGVVLSADVPDPPPPDDNGGNDGGTGTGGNNGGTNEENAPRPPADQPVAIPAGAGSPAKNEYTPQAIKDLVPFNLQPTVESAFKVVYSAVRPVPPQIAAALPYGTLTILSALALIYLYQFTQEARQRRRLSILMKRMKATEVARKNYLNLTSHYLGTPIAEMRSTVELLTGLKQLPAATTAKINEKIQLLVQHTNLLLNVTQEGAERPDTQLKNVKAASSKSFVLSANFLLPVLGVLVLTLVFNSLFIWSNKYHVSATNGIVQSALFVLGAVAMFVTYRQLQRQRLLTAATKGEHNIEQQITASQTELIENGGEMLLGDITSLSEFTPAIVKFQHGQVYADGVQSLKGITSKMDYLSKLKARGDVKPLTDKEVRDVISAAITNMQPVASSKGIELKTVLDPKLSMNIDRLGLQQLLASTIDNGIKFNKEGGVVMLTVRSLKKGAASISVEDTGVGIPKDKVHQLFEPFARGTDSLKYDYAGAGLDLYIDKVIVESFGGTISAESVEGKGTKITIGLPGPLDK